MRERGRLCRSERGHTGCTIKKEMYSKTKRVSKTHTDHQSLTRTFFHKQPTGTQINMEKGEPFALQQYQQDSSGSYRITNSSHQRLFFVLFLTYLGLKQQIDQASPAV